MPKSRLLCTAPLVALALAAAGCGGSGTAGDEPTQQVVAQGGGYELSATDTGDVLNALRTIDSRCGGYPGNATPGQDLPAAVKTIVRVTQSYPQQVYETGDSDRAETMRVIAGSTAALLRKCGAGDQAALLTRAAAVKG